MTQEPPSDDPVLPPPPATSGTTSDGLDRHGPAAVQSLRQAMRRARFDDAERVGVQADLRASQIARLELLQEALAPLLAQIPPTVDLFDVGLMPGTTPRLFIDMIGFVEMGRDARLYRLLQDTRHTRVTLAESVDIPTIVAAITDYVARRLLERDKALAADAIEDVSASGSAARPSTPPAATNAGPAPVATPARKRRPRLVRWAGATFSFVIDLFGAITFFTLLAFVGWLIWNRMHGQI